MTMERRALPGTDLRISPLCCGGGALGTALRGEDLDRFLGAFRDAGGNFFDTAHVYSFWMPGGDGASERALADYFRRHGGRDEVVIATKGGHSGRPHYRTVDFYLSPQRIAADLDDSLARLDCETIDLYWLHRDDTRLPAAEIVETLNAEIRRGRVRHVAASNWSHQRLEAANRYAAEHGLAGFVASQVEWSLAWRKPEQDTSGSGDVMLFLQDDGVAWHRRTGLPVMPYSPTGRGFFATGGRAGDAFDNPVSRGRLERARRLADDLGRSPTQVALAYLLHQPFPTFPILGTTKLDHLRDALAATEVRLTGEQVRWLRDGT